MKTTTGTISATGSGNGLSPTLNLSPPDAQAVVGIAGTHTGVTMVCEVRLVGGSLWFPALLRDRKTGTRYTGSVAVSTNDSASYRVDTAGVEQIRWYASAGTLSAVTAEVLTGSNNDFGGPAANIDLAFAGTATYAAGLTLSGATGLNTISIPDNLASAMDVTEGANSYLKFVTTDSSEGITVGKSITMGDGLNFVLNATTGTKIGTATSQKLGFFNATPVVQRSAYTQTYSTADRTHANPTATALTDNTAGTANTTLQALADGTTYANDVAAIRNNFADLAASCNALIADVADVKQLVNSVIDDLQALGFAG